MKTITLNEIRAASPFPWVTQVNFNGMGGVRMLDATGKEVPLLNITALAGILTTTLAAAPATAQAEGVS
ncbi:hypothetical protein WS84_28030 [Burkholderia anthina]|uniref:hypothetical protein n=1 Tax=Burkholderia anthina TaxID=179879 RepID=UPI00075A0140|nr:hypothetical protein [Burkholderia anthina]KVH05386.1 hypothetical protein WS84_28030 [Burkholderia anthina]